MIDEKIQEAHEAVNAALKLGFKSPAVLFSGGKDSVVMLEIILSMGMEPPIVFFREPFYLHKFAFGLKFLADRGLTAFDWTPSGFSLWEGKDIIAYTNHMQVGTFPDGRVATLDIPKNIVPTHKGDFLCGLTDILLRPMGSFTCPWDLFFTGHKNCDEDQIAGKVPLHVDVQRNTTGPSLAFPLRSWSHDDVWDYIEQTGIEVDTNRYDVANRKEWEDKRANSDYYHACIKCLDRREGPVVRCPKTGSQINNISDKVNYQNPSLDYYG